MTMRRPERGPESLASFALVVAMDEEPFFQREDLLGAGLQQPIRQLAAQPLGVLGRSRGFPPEQPSSIHLADDAQQSHLIIIRPGARADRYLTASSQSLEKRPLREHLQSGRSVVQERNLIHHRSSIPALQTQRPLAHRAHAYLRGEIFA